VYASWTSNGSTVRAGAGKIPLGAWKAVSVHVVTNGSASTVEVAIDGTLVLQTSAAVLGTTGVKTVQLGNDTAAQAFSLVADDVLVK
jgi:Na+/alanine symporter